MKQRNALEGAIIPPKQKEQLEKSASCAKINRGGKYTVYAVYGKKNVVNDKPKYSR